jgi:hypothetical protein
MQIDRSMKIFDLQDYMGLVYTYALPCEYVNAFYNRFVFVELKRI